MAVYYKFKSARDYDSVQLDGAFISVGALKEKIFESKHLGRGTDFDLVVTNAQTNEEYLDEAMLIPKNTSVLIRRVPGRPRMTIVTEQETNVESKIEEVQPEKSSTVGPDPSAFSYQNDESEWDEFGNDLYALPEAPSVQTSNPIPDAAPTNRADEEDKLMALINTPALDWQRQGADSFGPGRGFGRGGGGRFGGRGGGGFGMERKNPPEGYVCFRCNVPGHFIQHCPTNGDPTYDVKRVKQPTGIPKSMLITSTDGSYALPNGSVAVLKPNEDAFEREMEGLPSTTRTVGELPPELRCPLCKEVMKDAVLTSKCCFNSFCDKCIRDHIISKSVCVCGAGNVLADDLLPNKTVRDTISRILEAGTSSAENAGSAYQVQDMESARDPQPKIPSPTMSYASKGDENPPIKINETQTTNPSELKASAPLPAPQQQQVSDKGKIPKVPDVAEATRDVAASQGSGMPLEEEVQQKAASSEAGKKKKKKKVRVPGNEMQQWRNQQEYPVDNNYMMPPGPAAAYNNNPYWNGMPPFMDGGYMGGPYNNGMPYNMGYGMGGPMQFMGLMPPDPFSAPGYNMMPPFPHRPPPQRNHPGFNMGMNNNGPPPPVMSREEFEARKADLRRKRENDSRMDSSSRREGPKDRDYGRDMSGAGNGSFMQPKKPSSHVSSTSERYRDKDRHRSERPSPTRSRDSPESPPRASKRKSEHRDRDKDRHNRDYHDRDYHDRSIQSRHESSAKKLPSSEPPPQTTKPGPPPPESSSSKASVFSRIRLPETEPPKKRTKVEASPSNGYSTYEERKSSSSSSAKVGTAPVSARKRSSTVDEYESSDDDEERHFKRKPSRYEPSPPPVEEEARGSRDRDRKHR